MSKGRDRTVSRRTVVTRENKRNDGSKASSVHRTQKEAEQAARNILRNQSGDESTTKVSMARFGARIQLRPARTRTHRKIRNTNPYE
jgi:hypothetical protein